MKKALVVVDYQNDFVDGALGFPRAVQLHDGIATLVKSYLDSGDRVIFTLDTHGDDYLTTREGASLPVPHCTVGSKGWRLYGGLAEYMDSPNVTLIQKQTFGTLNYADVFDTAPDEVTLVGVVTNMCVISNAITLQTLYPNAQIIVESSLCASFNEDLHNKSLDVMAGLQIQVH